ncbi:MAG: MotA/TolQ/ExbB proton channel family protein [Myxococcota bacterium]
MKASSRYAFQVCTFVTCALCVFFALGAAPKAASQTLDEAYKAELTRLKAEEDAMRTSLRKAQSRAKRARASLVSEIEALSSKLTRLRAENGNQETQLPHAERMHSIDNQERSIERRQVQIETWLETHGVSVPTGTDAADEHAGPGHEHPPLDAMVAAALEHIEEHGQLRVQSQQEYFGADGVATLGTVVHIAEVGAIAIDDGFKPLDLAPDGSLRITPQFAPEPVSHGESRSVGVVLFDPDDIRPLREVDIGWRAWMDKGGVVMWAIAALALLAMLLFLERLAAFVFYSLRLIAAERRGPRSPVTEGDTLLRAVAAVQRGRGDADQLESQAVEALLQSQAVVRRGVSLLAVVAAVAPLLGLLGTVTGMIGTFAVITEHGTGDPRLLSGGISAALLTTQFGLMVAIPALLMQTTLYRTGDVILRRIERFALSALKVRVAGLEHEFVPGNIIAVKSDR